MSEIEVFHDESLTDSSDPPAAVQSTSAPQDNSTEPAAAIRGRRPSRTTAANASKRRSPPSPSPPRQQPPSPASSYTSVFSHAPSAENWTVAGLRQVITSAGVIIPRRSSKADLLALYNSLQSGELQKSSTPLKSAATASKSRKSPYSRPGPTFTPSRTGLRPPNRSGRPSASLGRAPDVAALSPHLPRASTEHQLAIQPSEEPAFASTSRLTRTSTPPSAAYSYTQPRTNEPLPYPWPAAPPLTASPTPSAQAPAPAYPPPFPPPLSIHQALSGSNLPQSSTQTPAIPPLFNAVSSVPGAPFSLSTASPLPIPPNALALEPPPVANSIRSQILSGTDIDLFSLLSPISPPSADRQIDCGEFSVTLKNSANNPSRILSFTEFTIAFNRYTEVICTTFPHRRCELGDYLAIIAELALAYGGSHFYTYHKLFSAKCAIRVAQWNQCPYWGALDNELHNRVFLGCRNITCAVCRSISHSTTICPFINPSIPPCPEPSQPRSTSYVPRTSNFPYNPPPSLTSPPPFFLRKPGLRQLQHRQMLSAKMFERRNSRYPN